MAPMRRSLVSCERMTEKLILNSVLDILNLIPFSIVNCGHLLQGLSKLTDDCRTVLALYSLLQAFYVAFKQHSRKTAVTFLCVCFSSLAEPVARF